MGTISDKSPYNQDASHFLDQFDLSRRSLISNQFFTAVRSGAQSSDEVISAIKADALRRTLSEEDDRLEAQRQLLSLLGSEEARVYAQEIIDRESLPTAEKQRLKSERQEHYRREYLKAQPPTEKQLRFLKSLGCDTPPANRWEASRMIDGHVKAA